MPEVTDTHQEVVFWSGGIECAADLFLQDRPGRHPTLVIGHGWCQTKKGLRTEGQVLQRAGYNAMIIDYRGFGRSGGKRRGEIFPRRQVEDLRNALTYLQQRPEVDPDRLGIYGVSFAGGLAIYTAAFDRRIKACASQSPIVDGRRWLKDLRNARDFDLLLGQVQESFEASYGPAPHDWPKVKSNEEMTLPVPQAYREAMPPFDPDNPNSCAYPLLTQEDYDPMISFESIAHVLDFNPSNVVDLIAPRPFLMVGNAGGPYDWMHPPEPIQDCFARAGEPKELTFLPYDAYGLYMEPGRSESIAAIVKFFDKYL